MVMRVLHVIQRYFPYTGGSELYFQELSEQLARDGHDVTVITTDAWDLDHFWAPNRRRVAEPRATHNGVRILRFSVRRAPGPPIIYPILRRLMVELGRLPGTVPLVRRLGQLTPRVPGMAQYLRTTADHYDLVNSTNITLDFTIVPALAFAKRRGIPHVCTPFVHLGEPGSNYILRYYAQPHQIDLLKRSAAVLVQTSLEEDLLARRGVPEQLMVDIGGWVRPEALVGGDGARFRRTHGLDGPIVLSIGAAAYDKGTMHVIEAMQRLWRAGSPARLVLVSSNLLAQFERYWQALDPGAKTRITLLKAASHAQKLDALAAADVFAMPSRTDSFGIVFLEAWMYGLPVVGARAGGVPDVVEDGQDGFLAPFGDVAQIAARIQQLLDDPALAARLGAQGRAKVLDSLTFETKYRRVHALYEQLIAGAQP